MNSLFEFGHKIGNVVRDGVAAATPVLTESKFLSDGVLTPEEFLQAGDQLTFKFPSWQWEAGLPKCQWAYLPNNKQYLITKNVRCKERVRDLDEAIDNLQMGAPDAEDWALPPETAEQKKERWAQQAAGASGVRELPGASASGAAGNANAASSSSSKDGAAGAGDGKAMDISEFSGLDNMLKGGDDGFGGDGFEDDGFLMPDAGAENPKLRTYDLSITYDKYYQTPRLWLFGYDCYGRPLEPKEIYQDVLSEYVSKTITIDPHPLTNIPTCSIHPCKHSAVMKKVIANWQEEGLQPRHDLALFVFLKFISSVVPTIDYDFTMDIEL